MTAHDPTLRIPSSATSGKSGRTASRRASSASRRARGRLALAGGATAGLGAGLLSAGALGASLDAAALTALATGMSLTAIVVAARRPKRYPRRADSPSAETIQRPTSTQDQAVRAGCAAVNAAATAPRRAGRPDLAELTRDVAKRVPTDPTTRLNGRSAPTLRVAPLAGEDAFDAMLGDLAARAAAGGRG